jgi:protein-S-isoprenylcysteine O-methyltransferase Ste14
MSNKDMRRTVFGIGPKCMIVSIIFSLPVIIFAYLTHPKYVLRPPWKYPFRIVGAMFISVGLVSEAISARTMLKAFKQGELVTTGPYAICRHPMYSSEIMAILPGIALFAGMPLLLLVPVIIGLTLRFMMIKGEEEPLYELFGEEYLRYSAEVNAMLPTISCFRKIGLD